MSVRIVIVDDHKVFREGLKALLQGRAGMEVVGQAGDGRTAVKLARELRPDVVIMDVVMSNMNGVEATRQIVSKSGEVKVIGLSMHSDPRFVIEMLRAGASGYLPKDCAFEELADAIQSVVAKGRYISPKLTDGILGDYVRLFPEAEFSALSRLSPREREVVQLIAEGVSTRDIASKLRVSAKTVETYRRHIMEKLRINSIPELTKFAVREGLTSL